MNTILVIVLNYYVASACGIVLSGFAFLDEVFYSDWLLPAALLGSIFVIMFYLMATATHRSGASAAVVANKMSVIIPVIVAFIYFNDEISLLKVSGILIALLGIYFATIKDDSHGRFGMSFFILMLVFLGSGLIDTSIKLIEDAYLTGKSIVEFTTVLFIMAAIVGTFVLLFKAKSSHFNIQNVKALHGCFAGSCKFWFHLFSRECTKNSRSGIFRYFSIEQHRCCSVQYGFLRRVVW